MDSVGGKIRKVRKVRGYSQQSLSDGICSQSELSKIENNQLLPSADLCYKIANKLDINISELLDDNLQGIEIYKFKNLTELYYMRKFEECLNIIETLDKESLLKYEQLVSYLKGGCYYHLKKDLKEATKLLENGLFMTYTEFKLNPMPIEIHFINLLGVLYAENNNNMADTYLSKCLILIQKNLYQDIHYINFSKCYYNIAKYHLIKKRLIEAENAASKGIEWCLKNQTLYNLLDLYNLFIEIYNKSDKQKLSSKMQRLARALTSIYKIYKI
ncbi:MULTISPECIES: helix-turn-helix transcriptional regulator [Clostridium]|uniref:Helix-turn-helix transcriptional regulator n=1 Tax=Clostridium cibarium TaxID=2762247 RepID=A0ABR8PRV4_9CLOT|nr:MULTISPECIES: helix-turn-helix transcriptional regulator [Clostridium]MBD7910887.1 helix-turn-helix transcriptional regulator [Clostridium cibarium]